MGGGASGGITGGEFRVTGIPAGWTWTTVPNPEITTDIGDPMGDGVVFAYRDCQTGTDNKLLLYTVTVYPSAVVNDVILTVDMRNPPSNPNFPCSLLLLCDDPVYTKLCVCGGQGIVNGTIENCGCGVPTPVGQKTWGHVKSLYW